MADDELEDAFIRELQTIVDEAQAAADQALADAVRACNEAQALVMRELYGERGADPTPAPPAPETTAP